MSVSFTAEESSIVQEALRRYLSELRMEISDTDNPAYRRNLRTERAALEAAVAKLDAAVQADGEGVGGQPVRIELVQLWWQAGAED